MKIVAPIASFFTKSRLKSHRPFFTYNVPAIRREKLEKTSKIESFAFYSFLWKFRSLFLEIDFLSTKSKKAENILNIILFHSIPLASISKSPVILKKVTCSADCAKFFLKIFELILSCQSRICEGLCRDLILNILKINFEFWFVKRRFKGFWLVEDHFFI